MPSAVPAAAYIKSQAYVPLTQSQYVHPIVWNYPFSYDGKALDTLLILP